MGAWKSVILLENSDTGGPSLVVVSMEYLFSYQFWYGELWIENLWGGERKRYFVNFPCGGVFDVGGWGLVLLVLYTNLQLQIPCTYSLPTLHIYSTSNRMRIWNPVKHLLWRFIRRNSQRVKAVGYFRRKAPSCIFNRMFDRVLNGTLPNNLLNLEEGLRRSFPPVELHNLGR